MMKLFSSSHLNSEGRYLYSGSNSPEMSSFLCVQLLELDNHVYLPWQWGHKGQSVGKYRSQRFWHWSKNNKKRKIKKDKIRISNNWFDSQIIQTDPLFFNFWEKVF